MQSQLSLEVKTWFYAPNSLQDSIIKLQNYKIGVHHRMVKNRHAGTRRSSLKLNSLILCISAKAS